MELEELIEYGKTNEKEALELLKTLGKIPAPSHKEDKRAEFVSNWWKEHGAKNVHIDNAKNVVLALNDTGSNSLHVCMAHMDVVFPDETELPMVEEGNILRAPGIGDDTMNLTHLLICSKYMMEHETELEDGLLIVANACEEGLGNLDGSKEIQRVYGDRIKTWISFDGNAGGIVNRPVGSHRYRVTVKTEGGHSYGNFGRDNAIEILARIIEDLYKIETPTEAYTTYNVGVIEGGSTVNSIAQKASMLYEYRSSGESCLTIMKEKMNAIISSYQEEGKDIQVELLGERPGLGKIDIDALDKYSSLNASLVRPFVENEIEFSEGSTDANIPLSKGILANTIGTATGVGAHTREEYVDTDGLAPGISMVLSVLTSYMK